jgi:chromosome segregation ATPase
MSYYIDSNGDFGGDLNEGYALRGTKRAYEAMMGGQYNQQPASAFEFDEHNAPGSQTDDSEEDNPILPPGESQNGNKKSKRKKKSKSKKGSNNQTVDKSNDTDKFKQLEKINKKLQENLHNRDQAIQKNACANAKLQDRLSKQGQVMKKLEDEFTRWREVNKEKDKAIAKKSSTIAELESKIASQAHTIKTLKEMVARQRQALTLFTTGVELMRAGDEKDDDLIEIKKERK